MPLRFALACLCRRAEPSLCRSHLFFPGFIRPPQIQRNAENLEEKRGQFRNYSPTFLSSRYFRWRELVQLPASLFLVAPTDSCWLLASCLLLAPAAFGVTFEKPTAEGELPLSDSILERIEK
jgi:hypothetical protein